MATFTLPKEGTIFGADAGPEFGLMRISGGKLEQFDPRSILTEKERQGLGNVGNQLQESLNRLGVNFTNIPKFNVGDIKSALRTNEFISKAPKDFGFNVDQAPVPVGELPGVNIRQPLSGETPEQYQKATGFQMGATVTPEQAQAARNPSAPSYSLGGKPNLSLPSGTANQAAQAELIKARELQEKVNKFLIGQGKEPVALPGNASQGSNSALGATDPSQMGQSTSSALSGTSTRDLLANFGSDKLSFTDMLSQIKNAFGFDESAKEIEALDNAKIDEIASINDNPWISETLRSKRILATENKYDQKRTALVDRLKSNKDLAGLALTAFQNERELQKDLLFKEIDSKLKLMEVERKSTEKNVKEVRGGLYDLDTNTWIVDPKDGGDGLDTADRLRIAGQLRDDARQDPDIKVFPEVRQAYETISLQAQRGDAVGDLTLLRLYAKLTDPTSSVREEEFESMESAQGALARRGIRLTKGQITGEKLTEGARKQFVSAAKQIYETRQRNYQIASDRIRANATDAGVDPDRIITDQPAVITPKVTFEEKKQKLDEIAGTTSLQSNPSGFFDSFLSVFGLQRQ